MSKKIWVVRPKPNFVNRLELFLSEGMVAIGWPAVGDITGLLNKEQMSERLMEAYTHYQDDKRSELSVAAGILSRFVNDLLPGDYVMVPEKDQVYLAEVTSAYDYHPELNSDGPDAGFPHWHKVKYLHDKKPVCTIRELPLGVRRALDCHLTVFSINKAARSLADFFSKKGYHIDLAAPSPRDGGNGTQTDSWESPVSSTKESPREASEDSSKGEHQAAHMEKGHAESPTEAHKEGSHHESHPDGHGTHGKDGHARHQSQV
jgi:predicted Mrr-cat superfamily restriction endonuclease